MRKCNTRRLYSPKYILCDLCLHYSSLFVSHKCLHLQTTAIYGTYVELSITQRVAQICQYMEIFLAICYVLVFCTYAFSAPQKESSKIYLIFSYQSYGVHNIVVFCMSIMKCYMHAVVHICWCNQVEYMT